MSELVVRKLIVMEYNHEPAYNEPAHNEPAYNEPAYNDGVAQ